MFKIMIVDMNTNKTLLDAESNCIIGALREGDGTHVLGLTCTNAVEIAETMQKVGEVEKHLLEDKMVRVAYSVLNLMKESEKHHAE